MARPEGDPIRKEFLLFDACTEYLRKLSKREGIQNPRLPISTTQKKNCNRLCDVLKIFADESEYIDRRLEIYLKDDFSAIYLREKIEMGKDLMSVKVKKGELNGDVNMIIRVGITTLSYRKNEESLDILRVMLIGNIISPLNKYQYNRPKKS